jgi:metal-sulfur cluster biosynthetic enzyme
MQMKLRSVGRWRAEENISMLTKKQIEKVLDGVLDPELGISIVQMGLIYDIEIDGKNNVRILMTLTTIGCPLLDIITGMVKDAVQSLKGVKKVIVDLTFDPPWTTDKMSKSAKKMLGLS